MNKLSRVLVCTMSSLLLAGCWNGIPFQVDFSGKAKVDYPEGDPRRSDPQTPNASGSTSTDQTSTSEFVASWSKVSSLTAEVTSLTFPDFANGWVLTRSPQNGYSYTLQHTANRGVSWDVQIASAPRPLNSVAFANALVGLVGGDYGLLYKTADGGKNWTLVDWEGAGDFHVSIKGLAFKNATEALMTTADKLYKTNDGGATWTLMGSQGGKRLQYLPNGKAFFNFALDFQGDQWELRKLQDGAIKTVGTFGSDLVISFPDPAQEQIGFATDYNGRLFKSTDGGSTWDSVTKLNTGLEFKTIFSAKAVSFANPGDGMVLGNYADWFITRDGGATWAEKTLPWGNVVLDGAEFRLFDINHGYLNVPKNNTFTGGLYRLEP